MLASYMYVRTVVSLKVMSSGPFISVWVLCESLVEDDVFAANVRAVLTADVLLAVKDYVYSASSEKNVLQ